MSLPQIIILGAGLGGTIAAYEIRDAVKGQSGRHGRQRPGGLLVRPQQSLGRGPLARTRAIKVHLPPIMQKKGIGFTAVGAKRVHPQENRVELNDGTSLAYDYLVIATGPDLAFDEVEGLGPQASPNRFAAPTMPLMPPMPSTSFAKIPSRSWWAPRKAPHAMARPTNLR